MYRTISDCLLKIIVVIRKVPSRRHIRVRNLCRAVTVMIMIPCDHAEKILRFEMIATEHIFKRLLESFVLHRSNTIVVEIVTKGKCETPASWFEFWCVCLELNESEVNVRARSFRDRVHRASNSRFSWILIRPNWQTSPITHHYKIIETMNSQ